MIQLWVNLPSKHKMTKPKYQPISKEDIATYKLDNDGGEIRVIAGEVKGVKGPADIFSKVNIYNVDMRNNAKVSLNEPVIAHGPFVMNTEQEIIKAYQDYNLGKFGPFNF